MIQESLRYNSGYDLTDRDSVRQLLTTRKQQAGGIDGGGGGVATTQQPTTQASVTAISANSYHAATHQHQLNSVLNAAAQVRVFLTTCLLMFNDHYLFNLVKTYSTIFGNWNVIFAL